MKSIIAIIVIAAFSVGCEQKIEPAGSGQPTTVEKNTTVINPPAEKKTETNTTTVVNPPAGNH